MGEADREGGNGAEGGHGSTCVGARAIAHDGEGGGSDDSSRNDDNGYHDSNPLPSTAWRPRKYGCPHLFVTFTSNAYWPEILQALAPGQQPSDRPDIVDHDIGSASADNRLLLDELSYDITSIASTSANDINSLNTNQKEIFNSISNSVINNEGRTFFVYGYGGTGKTFLWTTLLNFVRTQGKIALAVASSGIAALLLPGGRTPHSRFKIPLDIRENSMCSIKKNTHLAELIQQTSLIVWDEAPVNHKYCFEALDRTLRDILSDIRPNAQHRQFGGITVAFGGDFRQTLPVIQNATRHQILRASIVNSYLWHQCVVLQLTENMRLSSQNLSPSDKEELRVFADWLLRVGNGTEPHISIENETNGYVPSNITTYFCDRAILPPINEVVSEINNKIIAQVTAAEMSYYSSDTIDDSCANHSTLEALYPTEFLNTISLNGLPDHVLHLKIGVPIMLLRNLDPSRDLIGVISHVGPYDYAGKTSSKKNRKLKIRNKDEQEQEIVLWGEYGESFDEAFVLQKSTDHKIVVAILAGLTAGTYLGKTEATSSSATQIYFDSDITEIAEYQSR
nr:uncharacterized protein LOC112937012 [Oryza sativa Japonica Group]